MVQLARKATKAQRPLTAPTELTALMALKVSKPRLGSTVTQVPKDKKAHQVSMAQTALMVTQVLMAPTALMASKDKKVRLAPKVQLQVRLFSRVT